MPPYQGQMAMSAMVYSSPAHIAMVSQVAVQHVHLSLGLHGVAVDGVFDLDRRIGVEVAKAAAEEGALPTCQNSQDRHSARAAGSVGRKAPNFSARCTRMAPDSKTRKGLSPLRSTMAGILELGLMSTKPLENWLPR